MQDINATGASAGQPGSPPSAESVLRQYRTAEARLTRRLRVTTVVVVAAAAFIGYAVSAGAGAGPTSTAIAGTLTCLAAAGRLRASRNRVRHLLRSGEAEKIAHRVAEAAAAPQPAGPPPLFSQEYCTVNRQAVGGRLQAGPVPPVFRVEIRGSQLAVTEAPGIPVIPPVPVANARITTPRLQRRLGTGTTLEIGGQFWGIDFSGAYRAERHIGFLRSAFSFGSPRKAVRRGREINDRFIAALLSSGASQ